MCALNGEDLLTLTALRASRPSLIRSQKRPPSRCSVWFICREWVKQFIVLEICWIFQNFGTLHLVFLRLLEVLEKGAFPKSIRWYSPAFECLATVACPIIRRTDWTHFSSAVQEVDRLENKLAVQWRNQSFMKGIYRLVIIMISEEMNRLGKTLFV